MDSAASEPVLIGVDWGTSSLRAFLIGTAGQVLAGTSSSEGIMQMPNQAFEAVLDRLIAPWVGVTPLPILASGMITSRIGWLETPYADTPIDAISLASVLAPHLTAGGKQIHFVTGASTGQADKPDVMRGEETQVIGVLAGGVNDGTFVLPGTHSKWVQVSNGQIVDFSTYMTGEIFAALKGHTILGTLMEDAEFNLDGFETGVMAGLEGKGNLLHNLFYVRTLPLRDRLPRIATADYLSGLLIGTEVAAATGGGDTIAAVTLVGRSDLSERYEIALRIAGLESRRASEDIVAMGHYSIASAAGLVK